MSNTLIQNAQTWWNNTNQEDKDRLIRFYFNEGFVPNQNSILMMYADVMESDSECRREFQDDEIYTTLSMDNYIHPSLLVEVPLQLRKEIYEQSLAIQGNAEITSKISKGLCLQLPCLLWNLEHYTDNAVHHDHYWSFDDTKIAFPELTYEQIRRINGTDSGEETDSLRILVLQEMIQEVNLKLQQHEQSNLGRMDSTALH